MSEEYEPHTEEEVRQSAADTLRHARLDTKGIIWGKRSKDDRRSAWRTLESASLSAASMCAQWTAAGDPFAMHQAVKWARVFVLLDDRRKRMFRFLK
jgi:hypothetical protein